jgi:hypothetical protein
MSGEKVLLAGICDDSQLTPKQEAKLDYIVDTTGCSYDDAERLMGLPVYDPTEVGKLIQVYPVNDLVETAIRGFFCGDCCKYVEPGEKCPHVRVGSRGGRYASDDGRY